MYEPIKAKEAAGEALSLAEHLCLWYEHYQGINYQTQLPTLAEVESWLNQLDYLLVDYVGPQEPLGALTIDQGVLGVIGNPRHPLKAKRWGLRAISDLKYPRPVVGFVYPHNTPIIRVATKLAAQVIKYEDGLVGFIFDSNRSDTHG